MSMLKLNVELHKLVMGIAIVKLQNTDTKNVTRHLKIIDISKQQDIEN